jgi:tripartite-type tricarboxylate transporter receptor subunit TctC
MNTKGYKEKAAIYGYDIGNESPASFNQFVKDEIAKWGKVIKDANIKID